MTQGVRREQLTATYQTLVLTHYAMHGSRLAALYAPTLMRSAACTPMPCSQTESSRGDSIEERMLQTKLYAGIACYSCHKAIT